MVSVIKPYLLIMRTVRLYFTSLYFTYYDYVTLA